VTGCKKGPAGGWEVGPAERSPGPGLPSHYNTLQLPIAIGWRKGERVIVLGKLLLLNGHPALATAYGWRPLPGRISLPDLAIRLLCRLGVRTWLVRDDLRRLCWEIALPELLRAPMKGGERFISLKDAKAVPWRWWPYAERTVDLLELVQALEERQLPLGEVRA
jgi:hypothetical protein